MTDPHTLFLAAWDAGVGVYLALDWTLIHSLDGHATGDRVQRLGQRGYVVFLIVVGAAYAPELNPVEYIWAYMKAREIANLCASTID